MYMYGVFLYWFRKLIQGYIQDLLNIEFTLNTPIVGRELNSYL